MIGSIIIILGLSGCSESFAKNVPAPTETLIQPTINVVIPPFDTPRAAATSLPEVVPPETVLPEGDKKLEILSHQWVKSSVSIVVSGTARNSATSNLTYAEVLVRLYDANGKI
jgi:hypothetical protein